MPANPQREDPTGPSTFRFVQFEFPWLLGPADGRYVLRDEPGAEAAAIAVLTTLGAPQRRLIARRGPRSRRSRPGADPTPASVPTGRATIVDAHPLGADEAADWLHQIDAEAEIARAVTTLNRVLHAHRIAAADPYIHELAAGQALVIRAGFGVGERVADGRWTEAVELRAPGARQRRRRAAVLRPQERLAALLGARDSALACEELALRARADLDAERVGAAALGTRLALEAALVELAPSMPAAGMSERLEELRSLRDDVIAAANTALAAPLSSQQGETVAHALGRVEAALRARSAAST